MQLETRKTVLSRGQKKRILQWKIPHLIATLKKEKGLSFTYLSEPLALSPNTTQSFVFNGHIGFPLFAGVESLGLLLCFNKLTVSQKKYIRQQIDLYLLLEPQKEGVLSFPLLIRKENQVALLRTAHKIYLQTPAFAFVNADDLKWQEGLFKNMNGVFVCIPFFHRLSVGQKQILAQELSQKKLPCRVVMGLRPKDTLPIRMAKLFSPA